MTILRPIETHYKGYRFRSRLEARWAVFFEALGLKWEYEPEGFVTSAGSYLPDFRVWTPQGKPMWYEVKPEHVKSDAKFEAFAAANLDAWSQLPEVDRKGESLARAALLSGDPVDMLTRGKTTVCHRCGHIKRGAPVLVYTMLHDLGILTAGQRARMVYCSSCFLETQHWQNHETTQPNLMHIAYLHGFGLFDLPYGTSNGWVTVPESMPRRVMNAATTARAARFEHGERG